MLQPPTNNNEIIHHLIHNLHFLQFFTSSASSSSVFPKTEKFLQSFDLLTTMIEASAKLHALNAYWD